MRSSANRAYKNRDARHPYLLIVLLKEGCTPECQEHHRHWEGHVSGCLVTELLYRILLKSLLISDCSKSMSLVNLPPLPVLSSFPSLTFCTFSPPSVPFLLLFPSFLLPFPLLSLLSSVCANTRADVCGGQKTVLVSVFPVI